MVNETVSHYKIEEKIGQGGMGVVYKAWDEKLDRHVALKFLPPTLTWSAEAKKRFVREAKAVSALDHPNLVTIYDIDEASDGRTFIAMAYYEGESLRALLEKRRMEVRETIDLIMQAASGLARTHQAGIVHRDIKPENIIVTSGGVVKVVDFGLASLKGESRITDPDLTVGTAAYMSPEQVSGDRVDARSDIFALTVVLYEILTGQHPFDAELDIAMMYRTLNEAPRAITDVDPTLPVELKEIVDRGLSKDPDDRYQHISEMIHDLGIVQRRLQSVVSSGERLIAAVRWTRSRRRRTLMLAGLVVLAVVGSRLWPMLRGGRPTPRIMVVKWENTVQQPELDWISGAVMSDLIRVLSHLDGYRVISRQTVAATAAVVKPKLSSVSPLSLETASQVGAAYLVSGAFRPSAGWIHLECELSSVGGDGSLMGSWSAEVTDSTHFHDAVVELALELAKALGASWRENPRTTNGATGPQTASIDALKLYQRALEAYELADVPKALVNLRAAVEEDSTFVEAHLLIARIAPNTQEQEEHLMLAMKYRMKASAAVRKLVEAEYLAFNEQRDPAIEKYEEILADDPEQVTARKALALLYRQARRFAEAGAEYSILRRISPFDYSFYGDWAMVYVELDRRDKAAALIADWRKRFPSQHVPLREVISLDERIGNYADGQAICDSLARDDSTAVPIMCAWILSHVGRLNEAEQMFRTLVESPDPFLPQSRGFAYLAYLCYERRDYATGLGYIERALAHQEEAYYLWMAGVLAAGAGEFDRADGYAERIARYFEGADDDENVREAIGKRRFYYHVKGKIALEQGDPAHAVQWFREAMKYTSRVDDPYFRTDLGSAYLQANQLRDAAREFEQVLRSVPAYPHALLYLGETRVLQHQYASAQVVLDRLKTLWNRADADDPLNMELNRLLETCATHR